LFEGNSHYLLKGAGIYFRQNCNANLINVTFKNNTGICGGGIYCYSNITLSLVNVMFRDNIASGGGGIYCKGFADLSLENVTITNNTVPQGGAIFCLSGSSTNIMLNNCILWNNSPHEIYIARGDPASVTLSYTDIKGGNNGIYGNTNLYWLEGNINEDPLFLGYGDYPYLLSSGSPCIDAGDPDTVYNDPEDPNNLGYALWPAMGTIRNDMGAYGGPNAANWNIIVTAIEDEEAKDLQIPTEFELAQNYPNPFNPSTTIQYGIKERSSVELILYDILGAQVTVLVNEEQDAGFYNVNFNAGRLASGVYLYRIQAGDFIQTKKMVLMK